MDLRIAEQPMPLKRPTVLILSNDPAFAREVTANWPDDPNEPEFTVLAEGLFRDLGGSHYDLAIADAFSPESCNALKHALATAAKPAVIIHGEPGPAVLRTEGSIIELGREMPGDGAARGKAWAAMAGLIGREILRRAAAEVRQRHAETICASVEAEAVLGRYMIEMRHNVNNALTSVLGNAELLTLEPGLPANVLAQADTVRNMALRLHEVFQRFSSIEKELSVAARESNKKTHSRAAASGRQA